MRCHDQPRRPATDRWRYADWLPTDGLALGDDGAPAASMGEGWTPLVDAPHLAATAAAEFDVEAPPRIRRRPHALAGVDADAVPFALK